MPATSERPAAARRGARPPAGAARPVERAYARIRAAILAGGLPPGAHLREEALTVMTGTSRTPVREALRRLVAEGLATANHRRRYVSDFSAEEVAIVFDVRARLESYAAGVAAPKIRADEVERLRALVLAIDRLAAENPPDADRRFVALNADFHRIVVEAARSPQLLALATPALALPLVMIKQFLWYQSIDIRRSNDQHRDIVAALAAGNAEWAASAMQGHILSTKPRPAP